MRYLLVALILWPLQGQAAESATAAAPVKAVLVTGASTGIGRNPTERLSAAGYFVYAGARKDADLAALGKRKNSVGRDHAGAVRREAETPLHGYAGSERDGTHDSQATGAACAAQ